MRSAPLFTALLVAACAATAGAPSRARAKMGLALEAVLLEPSGEPLASERIRFDFDLGRSGGLQLHATTDPTGAVILRFRSPDPPAEKETRSAHLTLWRGEQLLENVVELDGTTEGTIDLGTLTLFDPDAPDRWWSFEDAELLREWERCRSLALGLECEGILKEMARRGGSRWAAFLEELAFEADHRANGLPALSIARALRIARGDGDPLELRILDESLPSSWTFGALPVLVLALQNVSEDTTLPVTEGGSYRSGRFARIAVDVLGESGVRVETLPPPSSFGGGFIERGHLGPGQKRLLPLELALHVPPLQPGRYTLVIHYHDTAGLADIGHPFAYFNVVAEPLEITVVPRRAGWIMGPCHRINWLHHPGSLLSSALGDHRWYPI